ncbi:putative transducer [Campylobacter sputorum subsp. bubulus]|uniref:Putative transducer n=1 Tax=Campylobacter sputorum subsp. sputorum TaxID=32024 RepID=A0A381DHT9_9BACT|nr:cache domain-containing protein [Campylobacter sputorum]KAB0582961.1 hypothetical protein F7P64_02170 [Campylobacter sputorum subsp. sputorum]SUX08696.1 putative transducer [Campylobacter sputorum subsp. bubulus]SUX10248.1 putative transducer [Campylobacter sputorum subsp. sputorum]
MLTKFKILTQMLLINLGLVFIVLIALIAISSNRVYSISSQDMDELMMTKSQEISKATTAILNTPVNVAKTLSNAVSIPISQNNPLRPQEIENLLLETLKSYPELVGAWFHADNGKYYPIDELKAGDITHTKYGDYAVYATRSGSDVKLDKASDEFRSDDFYSRAKSLRQPIVTEPYFYEINAQKVMITTFSVPIELNGEFIGVIGCDISLEELNKNLAQTKILESGFVSIISQEGNFVTHKNKEMLGKSLETADDELVQVRKILENGKHTKVTYHSDVRNRDMITDVTPIKIRDIDTTWATMVVTMKDERVKEVEKLRNNMIILGLVFLILLCIPIFYTQNTYQKELLSLQMVLKFSLIS